MGKFFFWEGKRLFVCKNACFLLFSAFLHCLVFAEGFNTLTSVLAKNVRAYGGHSVMVHETTNSLNSFRKKPKINLNYSRRKCILQMYKTIWFDIQQPETWKPSWNIIVAFICRFFYTSIGCIVVCRRHLFSTPTN